MSRATISTFLILVGLWNNTTGIHSQIQTRAAARYPWRVDLRLDPFFSREAASQGGMTVSGVQAQGVVWESMRPCGASVLHSRDDCAPLFGAAVRFRRDDVDLQTARFLFGELLKCRGRRYQLFSFSLDSGTTPQEFIPRAPCSKESERKCCLTPSFPL